MLLTSDPSLWSQFLLFNVGEKKKKKNKEGAEERAEWVKELLHVCEDLSLDTQELRMAVHESVTPTLEGQRQVDAQNLLTNLSSWISDF